MNRQCHRTLGAADLGRRPDARVHRPEQVEGGAPPVPAGLRACVNAAAAPQEEYRFELRLQGGDMEGSLLGLIM